MTPYVSELMKCKGCGAEIQFNDPAKPGFIPFDVYERKIENGEEVICQRCFRLKHYNVFTECAQENDMLDFLKNSHKHFDKYVFVFDIFDFEGTYRKEVIETIKDKPVYYVANKFDTLPRAVSASQLKSWLLKRLEFFDEKKDIIFITSTKHGFGTSRLKETLEKENGKILFIGTTNVGKSSLLSFMYKDIKVVSSPFPKTTIGILEIEVNKKLRIFDSPGIIINDRVIDLLSSDCQAKVFGKGETSRKTFKIDEDTHLFVSGLCKLQVEFEGEYKPIFQVFLPKAVTFHQTKNAKFINNFTKHFGGMLFPPCSIEEHPEIEYKEVEVEFNENVEVSIPGLCWINIKRGIGKFKITLPINVTPIIREPLIKPIRD